MSAPIAPWSWAVGGLARLAAEVFFSGVAGELVLGRRRNSASSETVESSPSAAADVCPQVARWAAGEESAAQDGPERLGSIWAPTAADRLGYGIGLLGGQAALFDGEGRRVAGREHVVDAREHGSARRCG